MNIQETVSEIISEQSMVIGEDLAMQMALSSGVIKFNNKNIKDFVITEHNDTTALSKLINSYKSLFGMASVEVCFNVVKRHSADSPDTIKEISKQVN